ncbi:MAG: hypothetical protein FJ304_03780 [Planctomycetes bacterium]|nr:hypothetical protein [Planctomycetota bacterium]
METTPDFRPTETPNPPPGAALGTADPALPVVPGYEVLELIGRGGMGRVYRARHLGLGRVVALKLLLHEADDHLLARFREEARAVARLQHPNIAQLYESGSAGGRPYFAQEFVDGGALARALAGAPQPPRDAADLVEVVARAVHHSHTQGIIHRDLKPGNILLARKEGAGDGPFRLADFVPKVADFGLAKTVASRGADTKPDSGGALTRTGEILGTPGYMPPEQASGVVANVGPPADVYALGAVLYEALTGRPPFQMPDPVQTLMLVLTRDPVPPRALQPDVPRDLETICLKCLEKQPRKRYDTARDLADDLRRYLDGRPIVARPVGLFERLAKLARRNVALTVTSAVAALIVLGSAVALGVGYLKLRDANTELAAKNTQLDQANKDITAEKENVENANKSILAEKVRTEQEKEQKQKTLMITLVSLDRSFFEMSDRLKELPGSEPIRLGVLKQAKRTLDGLAEFLAADADILNYRMAGYDRLGNLESATGDLTAAEQSYTKCRDIATELEARFPGEMLYTRNRLFATAKLGGLKHWRGDLKGSDEVLDAVAPAAIRLAAAHPDDARALELLALVRLELHYRDMRLKKWDTTEAQMRELTDIYRRLAKAEPENPARRRDVIDANRRLAMFLLSFDDPAKTKEVGEMLGRAADEADALPDQSSVAARELRARLKYTIASYHDARKDHAKAITAYKAALAEYDTLAAQFNYLPLYRYSSASLLYSLAVPTSATGEVKTAIAYLEKAQQLLADLVKQHPDDAGYRDLLARVSDLLNKVRPKKPPDPKP